MSDVLCLVDHLIERARRLMASFQYAAARELLDDVREFSLSSARAEEVERLLAEGYFQQRRYRRAAHHFRKACEIAPRNARYHHMLGLCVASHSRGRHERAAEHFRRALELAPTHRRCRADAGLLAVRMGKIEEGLAMLRQATDGAPDLLPKLIRGYREAGRPEEARRSIQQARFASPRDARLAALWAELQTGQLRQDQAVTPPAGPVLLPFLRLRRVP